MIHVDYQGRTMENTTTLQDHIQSLLDARDSGDKRTQAREHAALGKRYVRRNNYREGLRHYRKAAGLFRTLGMEEHHSRSLNHLGVCHLMLDDPHQALETLQRALDVPPGALKADVRGAILGNMGLAYTSVGDYTKAVECHRQVLEIARQNRLQSLELQALVNLGETNRQSGHLPQAIRRCHQARNLALEVNDQPSLIAIYDTLGMTASRQGNLKEARTYHHRAGEIALETGDLLRQAIALANEALALEGLTDLNNALPLMRQAHHIFQSLGSNYSKKTRKDLRRIKKGLEID